MLNPFSDDMQAHLAAGAAKLLYMGETFKDRMKRLRYRAGLKSQQKAADAIGCERGTVGMWEAPSSAVDSVSGDYLLAVARAYQVLPDYINTGKGEDGFPWSSDADAAPLHHSHLVRLDPDIVRGVARAMQDTARELGVELGIKDAVELFAELYSRVGESGITTADVVWLVRRLGQGASKHAGTGGISDGPRDAAGKVGERGTKG